MSKVNSELSGVSGQVKPESFVGVKRICGNVIHDKFVKFHIDLSAEQINLMMSLCCTENRMVLSLIKEMKDDAYETLIDMCPDELASLHSECFEIWECALCQYLVMESYIYNRPIPGVILTNDYLTDEEQKAMIEELISYGDLDTNHHRLPVHDLKLMVEQQRTRRANKVIAEYKRESAEFNAAVDRAEETKSRMKKQRKKKDRRNRHHKVV